MIGVIKLGYELRDYQKECIEVIESMNKGERKLISLPTGTGKTIIFSSIAIKTRGRVLIIVPSTELRQQAIDKILKLDQNINIGSVQGNLNELDCKIEIATRQSLTHKKSTRIERLLEHGEFEYIIIDEVHNAVKQIKTIISKINTDTKVVGFTATPYNSELKDIFNKVNYNKTILNMINNSYLCQPRAMEVVTGVDISNVKTCAGDFVQGALEDEINTTNRNNMIVEAYKKYASDRKHTIIFCSGIGHSNDIAQSFNDADIKCKSIDSKFGKEDRKEILDSFKNGDFPVITNCNILTTGFDFEALDCIILASPTKSKTKYVQEIGRGLRLHNTKKDCLIIDLKDIVKSFDLMSMSDIFNITIKSGESIQEAQERIEKETEEEAEKQRQREEAEKERERIQEELIAKEIQMFNTNMDRAFGSAYYDWFKLNNLMYAVSESSIIHYSIHNLNDEFIVYKLNTKKGENSVEEINRFNSIIEAIGFTESILENPQSFAYKKAPWKQEDVTEKQREYAINAETKWDAHLYFNRYLINRLIMRYEVGNLDI